MILYCPQEDCTERLCRKTIVKRCKFEKSGKGEEMSCSDCLVPGNLKCTIYFNLFNSHSKHTLLLFYMVEVQTKRSYTTCPPGPQWVWIQLHQPHLLPIKLFSFPRIINK